MPGAKGQAAMPGTLFKVSPALQQAATSAYRAAGIDLADIPFSALFPALSGSIADGQD